MEIRILEPIHWEDVKKIYSKGIATGNATFETEVPDWDKWNKNHLKDLRFISVENEKVIGWAALTSVSDRCIYAGVAEVSVYIDEEFKGKGIGKALLQKLIEESEKKNIWTLQAGIFPENEASISIHKKLGFRIVGFREKIGNMNGIWRDTILLERRSNKVGSV